MKRVAQLVVVAGLAVGVQGAWAGEGYVPAENDRRDTPEYFASLGAGGETSAMSREAAQPVLERKGRVSILEELGLAGNGPFPSSGGPIDGGGGGE